MPLICRFKPEFFCEGFMRRKLGGLLMEGHSDTKVSNGENFFIFKAGEENILGVR